MIIDIHVHLAIRDIYPKYWLDGITRDMFTGFQHDKRKKLTEAMLNSTLNDYNCDKLVASMDAASINHAVVVMADFDYSETDGSLSLPDLYSVHYKAIQKHPGRFQIFGGCDPRRGYLGYSAFENGIKAFNFKGLKLYPPCGFDMDDPAVLPLYDICDTHGLPVLLHIGKSLPGMKSDFDYPNSMRRVCNQYKNIPFILGHGAVLEYDDSIQLARDFENVFLDLSGFQNLFAQKEKLDGILYKLECQCPDKVIFGTDWPLYVDQKKCVEYIWETKSLTNTVKEKILYANAAGILKGW